jgi:hypothetical protein
MLKSFDFPAEGGSLNNMKARLSDLLGEEASGRARAGVDTLRQIFALRAGQQHHGADISAERARTRPRLGPVRYRLGWYMGRPAGNGRAGAHDNPGGDQPADRLAFPGRTSYDGTSEATARAHVHLPLRHGLGARPVLGGSSCGDIP